MTNGEISGTRAQDSGMGTGAQGSGAEGSGADTGAGAGGVRGGLVRDGAVAAGWPDEGVAAHYGDPAREQRAIAEGAALVDRSNRGVVTITGPDRLSWLHSLTTQVLENLQPGEAAQALILSPNGHVEHHLTVTDDGETTWLHVEPGTATQLTDFLNSMRFMLRVEVTDVTGTHAVLTVAGPQAQAQVTKAHAKEQTAGVVSPGAFGIDLIVKRDQLSQTADALGLPAAGIWAYEAFRIEHRLPRLGVDTDHRTLPHEVGWIETAVHLNKGCYRGQETVARVHNLGHPPRRLVFLHLDGSVDRLPEHGADVQTEDGTKVGFAGSSARHHELGPIGLALIKRTAPVDATLRADGIAAAQEVIVSPDAGGAATESLRRGGLLGARSRR